jgi:hypothetical protein
MIVKCPPGRATGSSGQSEADLHLLTRPRFRAPRARGCFPWQPSPAQRSGRRDFQAPCRGRLAVRSLFRGSPVVGPACVPRLVGNASALLPWPFRALPRPGAGRFSQQKVFQDKLPFAGDEWSTANTTCRLEIDGLWPHFCSDDLVQGIAVWAAEKRRFIRIRHERPQHFCIAPHGEHSCAARSKAGDLSQSASPQRCTALIHFRIRLRVRNTDHKTMVEKSMNDGSTIGGSC